MGRPVKLFPKSALEKRLNKDGLRYKMNRTEKEADEVGPLAGLPVLHAQPSHHW